MEPIHCAHRVVQIVQSLSHCGGYLNKQRAYASSVYLNLKGLCGNECIHKEGQFSDSNNVSVKKSKRV